MVPPSADVIDAAHKNGVPVLGTVFLPQTEHGGKIAWMRELIQKMTRVVFLWRTSCLKPLLITDLTDGLSIRRPREPHGKTLHKCRNS
nr:hypothetical protein [Paenibacillus larvae]